MGRQKRLFLVFHNSGWMPLFDIEKIRERELAAVVHDVRQMLAVITGRAGLLRHHPDHENREASLAAMEAAATQANTILSRLLPEPNQHSSGPCDIYQTLQQSAALIQPKPGTDWQFGHGLWRLEGNISQGCFTTIAPSILLEVLNNLLLNALGVMPDGGVLTVDVQRDGQMWSVRLQDSGPGIAAEHQEKIFELGFSSSGDSNRGIGLSSCRDLLASCGGVLQLDPTIGQGACFELLLPFTESKPEILWQQDPGKADLYRPTVLVVEDDQAVREMLEDVFATLGCPVKVARDAPAATKIFPTESFEMVIIDQTLPGMSGLEFAEGLRKQHPNLVLVLISGWGQEEILDKALGSVVDLVGEKPITLEKIMEMLDQAGAVSRRRLKGS